jgi:hypothetical protein
VWGEEEKIVWARIRLLNRSKTRCRPIVEGLAGAHVKSVYDLPGALSYIFKSPANAYRIRRTISSKSGKSKFVQRKERLRPGDTLNLLQQMRDLYLDDLTMAGGEGVDIRKEAKRVALKDFHSKAR